MTTMMIKLSLIYLSFFGICLTMVDSYDEQEIDVLDEIKIDNSSERFMKLVRIKRSGPSNTTFATSTTTSLANLSTSSLTTNTSYIFSSLIITSYTSSVSGTQLIQYMNQTTPYLNQTSSTTTYGLTVTSGTRRRSNTYLSYNPDNCFVPNYVRLINYTCDTKPHARTISVGLLRNQSRNSTETAQALSLYISSITNSTDLSNSNDTLSIKEIDDTVDGLNDVNLTINANTSFLTVQQPQDDDVIIILGASFKRGIGGEIVDTLNRDNITNSFLSAAAIVSEESLNGVVSLRLLIIDKPTGYENVDSITTKRIVSSVIVGSIRRNSSTYDLISISLYYKPLEEYKPHGQGQYLCSFYDTNSSQWSEVGCTDVYKNEEYHRYECNCTHLTSFALVWLPQSLSSENTTYAKNLGAQDIASLIFQSISILCFLIVMSHAIVIRMMDPNQGVKTIKLLPLISTASTTTLFIVFIALGMTVYTQTSTPDETKCFLSSTILMFITYFFLIFMFCVKTSVGYFYYLRFVRLFPHPSHRQLFMTLMISLFLSLVCVTLAIGLNTNSNYHITQLYPYRLCWFTREVIYYFLTIPIGICLVLNIMTITLVSRSIITHALNASTTEQMSGRMKRCVVVLLSSCVTQGIGWLFGPFISFVNPILGNILGWFFIILNGLEGFWTIVLYFLIRSQQLEEQRHASAVLNFSQSTRSSTSKDRSSSHPTDQEKNDLRATNQHLGKGRLYTFNDLHRKVTDLSNESTTDHDRVYQ